MARTADQMKGVKVAVEAAVASFFYALPTVDFSDTKRYMVEEAFGGKPYTYWVNNVRPCRFNRTLKEGILYRPTIVDEICAQISVCLSSETRKGLMMKGAQGTGKSHSLVNVVRKLHCSGNYLVTFFPDSTVNGGRTRAIFLTPFALRSEQTLRTWGLTLSNSLRFSRVTLWIFLSNLSTRPWKS
jgi:hypothetical protein